MIALPSMALSGFIVPVATLPGWLQVVSNFIPLTYAIDALRTVMLRGGGVGDISMDLIALVIFALLAFVGAALVSKETVA
jgi:ABC-2 type transport system permease protein